MSLTIDAAYADYKAAKAAKKTARDAVKQSQDANQTLVDLKEAKKQAAADYAAELAQWKGSNTRLLDALTDADAELKEAKERLDDLALMRKPPEQLCFDFECEGEKVRLTFTTKIEVQKEKKAEEKADQPEDADPVAA